MKIHGTSGIWTRATRAHVAADLAGEILLEQHIGRIRKLAELIRKVLSESGDRLDALALVHTAVRPETYRTVAPKKHKITRK